MDSAGLGYVILEGSYEHGYGIKKILGISRVGKQLLASQTVSLVVRNECHIITHELS
jgi:hypothetical protein